MSTLLRAGAACAVPLMLASCTSLFFVHDPQSGVISAGQLPDFIKAVRCELVTFYELERSRKLAYDRLVGSDPAAAFSDFAYFDIDPKLYGAFTLELKVTDSLGIGAGTAFDAKRVRDATHSDTLHFGPNLSGQGTYDLIWTFLIRQDASLSFSAPRVPLAYAAIGTAELGGSTCFAARPRDLTELERLADNIPPDQAQFRRIFVNGQIPLAGWLRDNGTLISANHLSPAQPSEQAEPANMYYSFAVQVIAGADIKYSLLTPQWNPLAVQGTGSLQQNSNLQIYVNGPGSPLANGAKSGTAVIGPQPPALGSPGRPMHVIEERQAPQAAPAEKELVQPPKKPEKKRRPARRVSPGAADKGYLMAPLPVFPPAPAQ